MKGCSSILTPSGRLQPCNMANDPLVGRLQPCNVANAPLVGRLQTCNGVPPLGRIAAAQWRYPLSLSI